MRRFINRSWTGFFALLVLSILAGCQSPVATPGPSAAAPGVERPVISPSGGRFADASVLVTMSCPTPGALLFWTDNDTTPTTASNRYTEPFRVWGTTVKLRAIAVTGNQTSPVAFATLTLNDGRAANQLGVIKGKVKLPATVTDVDLASINIFSDDLPGTVFHPDATGAFFLDGLDTSQPYNFYFTNQDLGPVVGTKRSLSRLGIGKPVVAVQVQQVLPAAGAGVNLNEVQLKKPGRIVGKAQMFGRTGVLQSDHTGIDLYAPGTSFSAKTDAAGNFTLSDIPEGMYTLRADRPGYTFKETTGVKVVSEADTNLTAEPLSIYYGYGTVSGSALLTDGSTDGISSQGILVLLRNLADSTSTFNTTTFSDGSYTLTNVEPGSYTAFLSKDGYGSQVVEGITVTGAQVTKLNSVSLPAVGGKISGKVPIKGLTDLGGTILVAKNEGSGKVFSTGTMKDGTYTFDPILPGTYTLTASHAGFSTQVFTGVALASGGNLSSLDFPELIPAVGSLTGTVSLEGAASFEGIGVTVRKSDDDSVSLSALTGTDGTYVLSGLKPGTYLVRFAKDGFLAGDGTTVTLTNSGVVTAASVVLTSSKAKLAGTALLDGKSDHSGIAVLATGNGGKTASTVTDANGRFALVGLDPDTYTLQATRDGYVTAKSDPQVLGAGAVKDGVSLALAVASRSLVGKVTLEGLTLFSGIRITATNLAAPTTGIYSALSNNEGYFALSGMVPGQYLVSFSKENYKSVTTNTVSLTSTSLVTLADQVLPQARGGVTGLAKLEGRTAHGGTKVTLVGTAFETATAADGGYNFQVPSGNYPGGVRFERADFETTMDTGTITVLTDSTYGVPTSTLKATHNTVGGTIDLQGSADDSGIAVAIDGQTAFTTTTAADGTWKFDHVPLGSTTFRFTRANTPDVTTTVVVGASEPVTLAKLDMIPNASSLKGWVKLDGMSDNSGITVTVTTDGKPNLTAVTNASGAFEIGNILSTGSHTVTASKPGWNNWTRTITDFAPLEVRTIGGLLDGISLTDTLAPNLSAVLINTGSNFTSSKLVSVALTQFEQGSGPDKMQVQLNGYPTDPNWETYSGSFSRALDTIFPTAFTGNGDYTVSIRVKDRSGNVSAWVGDTITMTDQTKVVSGVLTGDDLHWTKAKSPYRVEGNLLVESGQTLTIDAGVEVRFAGNYYVQVEGNISAVGSVTDGILFSTASDYNGNWNSIKVVQNAANTLQIDSDWQWVSGCRFKFVTFEKATSTLSGGRVHLEKCVLKSLIGGYEGVYLSSDISGSLPQGLVRDTRVHDVVFVTTGAATAGTYRNVEIRGITGLGALLLGGNMKNVSVVDVGKIVVKDGSYSAMKFANIGTIEIATTSTSSSQTTLRYSSFSNVTKLLTTTGKTGTLTSLNLGFNDWGSAWTQELDIVGLNANKSFTTDYYDDFTLVKLDLTGYLPAGSLVSTGYGGAALVDVDAFGATVGSTAYVGTKVYGSTGASIRLATDITSLATATWQVYSASANLDLGTLSTEREMVLWTQVRNQAGDTSVPIRVVCPIFDLAAVTGGSSSSIPNGTQNGSWSVSDFAMGKTEVTQRQWVALMGSNPSYTLYYDLDPERPVNTVSWYDCVEFANRLSWITGRAPVYSYNGYGNDSALWPSGWKSTIHSNIVFDTTANGFRLPTEAEWEWAARGGASSAGYLYSGSNTVDLVAWSMLNAASRSQLVAKKAANELGLFDMSGNVAEWCWDWSGGSLSGSNPLGNTTGTARAQRGGSVSSGDTGLVISARSSGMPSSGGGWSVGLRLTAKTP